MEQVLLIALALACPLMMVWMMRGHGRGGHHHGSRRQPPFRERSTTGLRELRDEIDRMIEERDPVERSESGWRADGQPVGSGGDRATIPQ